MSKKQIERDKDLQSLERRAKLIDEMVAKLNAETDAELAARKEAARAHCSPRKENES